MVRSALLATVLLLTAKPPSAQAQQAEPRPPAALAILHDRERQQELDLSTEQFDAVEDLWRGWEKAAAAFGEDDGYWPKRREYSQRALELLSDGQRGKLLRMLLRHDLERTSTPLFWLRYPRTQAELRLSGEQKNAIERLQSEWVERAFAALKGLEPTGPPHFPWLTRDIAAKRAELEREFQSRMDDELERILTADQRRRFNEITIQVETRTQGPRIFQDPRVAPALGFSVEQQERLSGLITELRNQNAANPLGSTERERQGIREVVSSILTPEQQRRWKELLGDPLDWTGATLLDGEPARPN